MAATEEHVEIEEREGSPTERVIVLHRGADTFVVAGTDGSTEAVNAAVDVLESVVGWAGTVSFFIDVQQREMRQVAGVDVREVPE